MSASAPTSPLATNLKKSRWGPRPTVSSPDTHFLEGDIHNPPSPLPQNQGGPGIAVEIDHGAETSTPSKVGQEASSPRDLLTSLKKSSTFAAMVISNENKGSTGGEDMVDMTGTKEGFALSSQSSHTTSRFLHQVHPISLSAVSGPTAKPEGPVRSQASLTGSSPSAAARLTTLDSSTPHHIIAQLISKFKNMPKPLQTSTTDPSSTYEQCRHLVAPLITRLAQARESNSSEPGNGAPLEEDVMALMNNELCAEFVDFAREVREELCAKHSQDGHSGENAVAGMKRRREDHDEGNEARTPRTSVSPSLSMEVLPRAPRAMRQGVIGSSFNKLREIAASDTRTRLPSSGHSSDTSQRPRPSQSHTYRRNQERPGRSTEPRQRDRNMSRESDGEIVDDGASLRQERQGSREMSQPPLLHRSRERDSDRHLPQEHPRREHSRESNALLDNHHQSTIRGQSREPGEVGTSPVAPGPSRPRDDEEDGELYEYGPGPHASRLDFPRITGPPHRSLPTPPLTKSTSRSVTPRAEHQPRAPSLQQSRYHNQPPRLWLAKVGLSQVDVLEAEFEVPPEIAVCCEMAAPSPVSMHLLCLPTAHVQGEYEKIEPAALPQVVADAMWRIKTQWPPSGSLIIQMKIGNTLSHSWLPEDLGSNTPPLDVTAYIRPVANHFRLVHLGDLSAYTFLIHSAPTAPSGAKPPPNLDAILPFSPATMFADQRRIDAEWDEYLSLSCQSKKPAFFNFSGAAVLLEL